MIVSAKRSTACAATNLEPNLFVNHAPTLDEPIAFMNLTYDKKSKTPGYIQAIFVVKGFRSEGIGSKLIEKAKIVLKEKGIPTLTISTDKRNNDQTIHFYEKLGFKKSKEEEDIVYLTLKLTKK